MACGFVDLAGSWIGLRATFWPGVFSITLGVDFCIDVVDAVLRAEIFNSDQGSQPRCDALTDILIKNGIAISMDGKGSWGDNVFVERFRRTVK
jgi:putative transposase